jgi:hypothetical protein|tara:strand:- start:227 stop:520 length:294 start_codon:yes stop_codon:yes gene_type:complete
MPITSETSVHRIEIVGDSHTVQVIEKTTVVDGDQVIAESKHMRVFPPLVQEGDQFVDQDVSSESEYIQSVCAAAWTDEAKAHYREMMSNLPNLQPGP